LVIVSMEWDFGPSSHGIVKIVS